MKKIKILSSIICITFFISCFLGTVHFCCFDENFYDKQHEKIMLYGKHVNEHIGISNDDLKQLTSFTLDYLNNPNATLDKVMNIKGIDREVFTNDEKLHMEDVRTLNLASVYLCVISFILCVSCIFIYIKNKYSISNLFFAYKKTIIYLLMLLTIIGMWAILDFDSFWTLFHKIFFAGNDLWLLDLRKDILIMIVPPEFFNNLVLRIVLLFISSIILMYFILFMFSRKKGIYND